MDVSELKLNQFYENVNAEGYYYTVIQEWSSGNKLVKCLWDGDTFVVNRYPANLEFRQLSVLETKKILVDLIK